VVVVVDAVVAIVAVVVVMVVVVVVPIVVVAIVVVAMGIVVDVTWQWSKLLSLVQCGTQLLWVLRYPICLC
jgi:hypothetical protein